MRASRLLILVLLCVAIDAADKVDVQKLMTPDEFQASGLGKLTPAEIDALNAWLIRYTAHEAPAVRKSSPEVKKEVEESADEVVRTQIDGAFTGWTGKTVFRLKNGQVWKQRMPGTYRYSGSNPDVEIYRGFMGLYWLRIVATGHAVGVAREG